MSIIVKSSESTHWYKGDGSAFHTYIAKDGQEKNVTLREARKEKAFPSVTSILGIIKKKGLDNWLIGQAIQSALTLPRKEFETDQQFIDRVVIDHQEHGRKAAELGTRIHKACEEYLKDRTIPADPQVRDLINPFVAWVQDNVMLTSFTERACSYKQFGYGGTMDASMTIKGIGTVLIDFKSQAIKEGNKPVFYDTWPLQLIAYKRMLRAEQNYQCQFIGNLIIETNRPGVHLQIWPEEMYREYWITFTAALQSWCYANNYYPVGKAWEKMPAFNPEKN